MKKDELREKNSYGGQCDANTLSPQMLRQEAKLYSKKFCNGENFEATKFICLEEVNSTNTYAKQVSSEGDCTVITADVQTAGRGRMGRSFYSPKSTGAYFSVVLHMPREFSDAVKFTSFTACAVCRAIENLTNLSPEIKWVNDIYIEGKKVCGILVESVCDEQNGKVKDLIIGIGINLTTEHFPDDLTIAGSLKSEVTRSEIIAGITCEILKEVPFITQNRHIEYYKSHSFVLGKPIYYVTNGVKREGVAVEVNCDCGLVVKDENGNLITLSSGEITVRVK